VFRRFFLPFILAHTSFSKLVIHHPFPLLRSSRNNFFLGLCTDVSVLFPPPLLFIGRRSPVRVAPTYWPLPPRFFFGQCLGPPWNIPMGCLENRLFLPRADLVPTSTPPEFQPWPDQLSLAPIFIYSAAGVPFPFFRGLRQNRTFPPPFRPCKFLAFSLGDLSS